MTSYEKAEVWSYIEQSTLQLLTTVRKQKTTAAKHRLAYLQNLVTQLEESENAEKEKEV